ncbi:hypothetical protein [Synechococcus sp. CS-1327]|uniref:hypothetical protein n=1 Tax=Synechococcus sp. CS-1327 TaxID=2847977 RepID=UPI00223C0210|nr:hypothetical protein [Synechococcus sp. CS-1327]
MDHLLMLSRQLPRDVFGHPKPQAQRNVTDPGNPIFSGSGSWIQAYDSQANLPDIRLDWHSVNPVLVMPWIIHPGLVSILPRLPRELFRSG